MSEPEDIAILFARRAGEDALRDRSVKALGELCRQRGCSQVACVYSGDRDDSKAYAETVLRQVEEDFGKSKGVSFSLMDETAVGKFLAAFGESIYYILPDVCALPEFLQARNKFLVAYTPYETDSLTVQAWPAQTDVRELCTQGKIRTPAWTHHFFPDLNSLQLKLVQMRTILLRKTQGLEAPQYILITGETGCGKSNLAKNLPRILLKAYDNPMTAFDEHGENKSCPFVSGNCASLSPELADSLIFGAKKGAYTGCDADRKGLIEAAGNGILFLDEVGELPLETQGKLLTALEEQSYTRLGDPGVERPITCNIVFGTNRDLAREANAWVATKGEKGFRRDLLFRINAYHLYIPPLRERLRRNTGRILWDMQLSVAKARYGFVFTRGARELLDKFMVSYDWRENFRAFTRLFMRLQVECVTCGTGSIVSQHAMQNVLKEFSSDLDGIPDDESLPERLFKRYKSESQRNELRQILRACSESTSCADAGRRFFGDAKTRNGKPRNYSLSMKNLLRKYRMSYALNCSEYNLRYAPNSKDGQT